MTIRTISVLQGKAGTLNEHMPALGFTAFSAAELYQLQAKLVGSTEITTLVVCDTEVEARQMDEDRMMREVNASLPLHLRLWVQQKVKAAT